MYFRFKYYLDIDRHVLDAMRVGDARAWRIWLNMLHPKTEPKNLMMNTG